MNYSQNSKINQVNEKTLVVGCDIAKNIHYARAFDWRGIELGKLIKFKANNNGFKTFLEWTTKIAYQYNKEKIITGIEPTSHYWYTFTQALDSNNILLVQVNPFHVKRTKELDDNSQEKSDLKDPKTIAKLVIEGRYQIPYIPKKEYADLRCAFDIREEQVQRKTQLKNRIYRWIDIYFPELLQVFKSWEGKTALITLKSFALPEKILELGEENILARWKKEVHRSIGIKRAKELVIAAKDSVGIKDGHTLALYNLQVMITEYEKCCEILEELKTMIESIADEIPYIDNILSIKGVGIITATGFIAEVGDINRFTSPKQIIKLAGLNVVKNSSGQHKGQGRISKRGRSRLRALLFRAILPIIATNKEFNVLHRYNTNKKINPMKKKQSAIALCCKLIKIMYRLSKYNERYDPDKMLKDIHRAEIRIVA